MKCYCDDDTCHYIKSQDEKCHQDCLGGEEADGQREVEAEVVVGQDDHLLDGDDHEAHQDHHLLEGDDHDADLTSMGRLPKSILSRNDSSSTVMFITVAMLFTTTFNFAGEVVWGKYWQKLLYYYY